MVSFERKYKEDSAVSVAPKSSDSYYPHSLYLDAKDVERLGLNDAKVGDKMVLVSEVEVFSKSINGDDRGKKRHSVQLRLTSGEVKKPKAGSADHAAKLFGKKETE